MILHTSSGKSRNRGERLFFSGCYRPFNFCSCCISFFLSRSNSTICRRILFLYCQRSFSKGLFKARADGPPAVPLRLATAAATRDCAAATIWDDFEQIKASKKRESGRAVVRKTFCRYASEDPPSVMCLVAPTTWLFLTVNKRIASRITQT